MSGILLDSIHPSAILAEIEKGTKWRNMIIRAAAGYVDGADSEWPPSAFIEVKTTGVPVVTITVTGLPNVLVADIETGDMTPATGAAWAATEHAAGHWPVLYVNRGNKPDTIRALEAAGLTTAGLDYGLWVSTLDDTFTDTDGSDLREQPGVVAVQYLADPGANVDVSIITATGDRWLGIGTPWQEIALAAAEQVQADAAELVKLLKANQ
jgi:hypothetical protein